jgi:toxin ParE1/3/4
MRIVSSPRSLRLLQGIYDYIRERNPPAALREHGEIRGKVEGLARHPRMGRPGRIDGTRELVVTGLPYIVVYRVRGDALEVAAVLHVARQWPERLS